MAAVAADVPDAAASGAACAPAEACAHLPAIRRFVRALLDPLYDAQVHMPRLSWVCCIGLKPCLDRPLHLTGMCCHCFQCVSYRQHCALLAARWSRVSSTSSWQRGLARRLRASHADARSAVFLVHEADSIRKLVQHYIQHYAAMGVG